VKRARKKNQPLAEILRQGPGNVDKLPRGTGALGRRSSPCMIVAQDLPVREGDVLAEKYRVTRLLGIGGMGAVVEAQHLVLGQRVAIKIVLPNFATDHERVQRFLREAKAASALRSEHVAKVLDVGMLPGGVPYLVMEFLEGTDLAKLLKERDRLPTEEAAEYILQACEALAEAHARGLVHRDIKPANLFITRRVDGSPLLKVLDFGIAKGQGGINEGMASADLTSSNALLGSPLYMSPEQMRSARDVDMRSDIWSLGIVLYKLLTGKVPYEASTFGELCMLIVQQTAPPPTDLCPEISLELSAVVLRCLEKDPSQRYENVAQLGAALLPFAPARTAVLVDRAAAVFAGFAVSSASLPRVSASRPSLHRDAGPPSATPPLAETGGPWGTTSAGPRADRRSRRVQIAVGAAAAAATLLVGLIWTRLSTERLDPERAAAPTSSTVSDQRPAALPAIEASAPSAADALKAASPSPAAEATATASAKASASAKPAPRQRPNDKDRPATPPTRAPRAREPAPMPDFGGRK
jgi:serine/threonine protein kinase